MQRTIHQPDRNRNTDPRIAGGSAAGRADAISLLESDHRDVEGLFARFRAGCPEDQQADLAERICQALRVHTAIEEEIFYPAFLEATGEAGIHHEAEVEHTAARDLIERIEAGGPQEEYFAAQITVLEEMIRHHVNEEERPDGMFAKARAAGMDLGELGDRMQQRKTELQAGDAVH